MEKRIFKAGKGGSFSNDQAQIYGEFIWKIREENGDVLSPVQVVEKARPKNSPIHEYFEWNDEIASEKYRIYQARQLIGRIEIIIKSDGEEDQIRAFHNITVLDGEDSERGYVTVQDVQTNEDYLEIVLENALQEIKSWQKRYSQYKRLGIFKPLKPLFKAITETIVNKKK